MPFLVSKSFPSKGILLTNFCKGEGKGCDDNFELFCMDCLMTDRQIDTVWNYKSVQNRYGCVRDRTVFPPYLGAVLIKH